MSRFAHSRRIARPHRPVSHGGTPGSCWCGLPLNTRNARHQVNAGSEAELADYEARRYR